MGKQSMEISEEEIDGLKKFVNELNQETGLIVVEGKRDFKALQNIGIRNKIVQFHKYRGTNNFADAVANNSKIILLLDGDRKGKYLTAKTIEKLERRTKIDLSFKKKMVHITKGKIRFIEQLVSYESILK